MDIAILKIMFIEENNYFITYFDFQFTWYIAGDEAIERHCKTYYTEVPGKCIG